MEAMEHQPECGMSESPKEMIAEKETESEVGSSVQNVPNAEPAASEGTEDITPDESCENDISEASLESEAITEIEVPTIDEKDKNEITTTVVSPVLRENLLTHLGKTELWLAKNKNATMKQLQKFTDEAKEKIASVKKLLQEGLSEPDACPGEFIQETRQYVEEVCHCLESMCKKAVECHASEMHALLDDLIAEMKTDLNLSEPVEAHSEVKDANSATGKKTESRMKKFREGPWMMITFVITMVVAVGIAPSMVFEKAEDLLVQSSAFIRNVTLF